MDDEHERRYLAKWFRAEMARVTGRAYRINIDHLDTASLPELRRLLRDATPNTRWPSSRRG